MSHGRRSTQVRVSEIPELGLGIAWHEAVALVRVAAQLVLLDPHAAPDATRMWLREDGSLRMEVQPRAAADANAAAAGEPPDLLAWPPPVDDLNRVLAMQVEGDGALTAISRTPGGLVAALSALLATLLPPHSPEGLRVLADPQCASLRDATPGTFFDALSFFARPGDDATLRSLAMRAMAAQDAADRAMALRLLTEQASARPTVPEPESMSEPEPTPAPEMRVAVTQRSQDARRILAGIGVGAAAGLAAAIWGLSATPAPRPVPPRISGPPVAASSIGAPVAPASAAVTNPAPAKRLPSPRLLTTPQAPRVDSRRSAVRPDGSGELSGSIADTSETTPIRRDDADATDLPTTPRASSNPPHDPARFFTAADGDVTPPTPLQAQLPSQPLTGVARDRSGVLELSIDESGRVMQARVIPATARIHDRMMLSAAKTWRFAAAQRAGVAVRYRLTLPITW